MNHSQNVSLFQLSVIAVYRVRPIEGVLNRKSPRRVIIQLWCPISVQKTFLVLNASFQSYAHEVDCRLRRNVYFDSSEAFEFTKWNRQSIVIFVSHWPSSSILHRCDFVSSLWIADCGRKAISAATLRVTLTFDFMTAIWCAVNHWTVQ